MRIMLENQPVFAGAWLTLVPVAQNVFRLRRRLRHERPLQAGVESGAAAPSQSRVLDLVDDRLRLHGERFPRGFVAVEFEVPVNVRRALSKALRDHSYLVGM